MPFETDLLIDKAKALPHDEASINCETSEYADETAARKAFAAVKTRIKHVSDWNRSSGLSTYELYDASGHQLDSAAIEIGQFIKITLTGSSKSDWVSVEWVEDAQNEIVITVKPTYDPTAEPQQTGETSHFFTAESRNNFCAIHVGRRVSVYVIGLDEKLNSDHTSGVLETARNAAVANLGYYLGIQKAEWSKFCRSMLDDLGGEAE